MAFFRAVLIATAGVILASTICLTNAKCGGKTILKTLKGTISDGPNNYPPKQHCEWLIEAPRKNMTITLEFLEYGTECTYDYLFVYDGPSYQSKLLGSFTGNCIPATIVATSGEMLIYLFSDTNYSMKGFKANYTIEDCPSQCSGHGSCSNGQCTCNQHWRGRSCELSWCPSNCNVDVNQGTCDFGNKHCTCSPGFAGESCSLALLTNADTNTWHKMVTYSEVFTPRLGHAAVYDHKTDTIWSFGGFNLNSADNNLFKFNLSTGQWTLVPTAEPQPVGRYSHTASLHKNELYIFGGQLTDTQLTNELWKLNLKTLKWTLLNDSNSPPPTTMHTANVIDDALYVFGGHAVNESFTSNMFKYDLSSAKTGWQRVKWKSGKPYAYRIMGHSTVFDNDTRSLVVFGGFQSAHARLSIRVNKLRSFHVDLLVWSEWNIKENVPKPRAFHTASIIGDYMAIFGGTVHEHYKDETCYDNELHFFNLKCRKWVPLSTLAELSPAPSKSDKPRRGRFSQVSLAKGSSLLIFGGYSGAALGDMHAYKLPISVLNSAFNKPGDQCDRYKTQQTCLSDPSCGWCSTNKCYAVQDSTKCSSTWKVSPCPGPCSVHTTCTPCVSCGAKHSPNCGWCVQDSQCYPLSSPQGACASPGGQSTKGWWGTQGQFLSGSEEKCLQNDYPPGLTEITRIFPENANYPDKVSHSTSTKMSIVDSIYKEVKTAIGFVHPFKLSEPPYYSHRKLFLYIQKENNDTQSSVLIQLSRDHSKNNVVAVSKCTLVQSSKSGSCKSSYNFPNPKKDQKYYMEIKAEKSQRGMLSALFWNMSLTFALINGPYLQPFSSGGSECSSKDNCMACMTDASCGWCQLTSQCVSRSSPNPCNHGGHGKYLVLNATQCTTCDDFDDCISCAQNKYCIWRDTYHACGRKGIHYLGKLISNPDNCSLPCERAKSCSSCLAQSSACAWCDSTSSCFVFGLYITRYPYGECTRWVDHNSKCQNCSVHTSCKSCLSDTNCGWCGSTDNPLRGGCVSGDFAGPSGGQCSSLVNLNESVAWSYGQCPDVDECRLGLYECHYNASCHNIYDSYNCVCNRGFTGDGKTACNKTCNPPCVRGVCKPDYTCLCDLGWKGVNCSIDCGCNGHSTCNQAVGVCDQCQDYTHGNHCELCVPGSYGNATTLKGCKKCDCNGHGDVVKGECDGNTGMCFCKDNTMGNNCEQCLPGLLGDPRNGGRCYYECTSHSILTNVTQGDISTMVGSGVQNRGKASCLWVISASTNTSHNVIYAQTPSQSHLSTITLDFTSMNLSCLTDHVDVYDGIPYFVLNVPSPQPPSFYQLGSYCGSVKPNPKKLTSVMGSMVVVFQGDISQVALSSGFEATFKVNHCPDSCHGNHHCIVTSIGQQCVCKKGWIGPDCSVLVCPNNCTSSKGQGVCNMAQGQCECNTGFTGLDCSKSIPLGKGFWTTLHKNSFPNSSYSEQSRIGHTLVVHDNYVWIYGGFSMAYGILDSMYRYDVIAKTMSHVTSNQLPQSLPKGRYFHCAVLHQVSWFVYGGLTKDSVSDEMWYFDVKLTKWSKITFNPGTNRPKIAGHTCTLVNDVITIIGGYDPMTGFNNKIYQYSIPSKTWSIMQPLETGTSPAGLYGHSTVYHSSSQILFVFGGYQFKLHEVKPSSDLYTLHLPSRQWKLLEAMPANKPMPRFFHAAAIVGDFMVVYGGRTTTSQQSSSDLLVYKIQCNYWHTLNKQDSAVLGFYPGPIASAAAATNESSIFFFGGLNGQASDSLHKLRLPSDLCQGMRDKNSCSSSPGCSWCEVHYSNISSSQSYIQSSACYSVLSYVPSSCHATSNVTQVAFVNGTLCNSVTAQERNCDTYSSCSSCLSSYPGSSSNSVKCSWCVQCSGSGKCIDKSKGCVSTSQCGISSPKHTSPSTCPENICETSTCKDCVSNNKCMWTPQVKWLSETQLVVSLIVFSFPWNCFQRSLKDQYININIAYTNIANCPKHCERHRDCRSCLEDTGGDGGWKECVWSETLGQCYSPSHLPMVELAGVGGRIVRGSSDQCMPPCAYHDRCSSCFTAYNCGWCSQSNSNGQGACMEGGVKGPLHGTCHGNTIDTGPQTPSNLSKKITTSVPPVWASVLCPLENECTNGRDNCSHVEQCVDTPESYRCICKPGYKREGNVCLPVCHGGCGHGVCVTPNNCSCNFGWTSRDCSIKCQCNNHGRCLNESTLDTCYDCRNNTKGKSCELCSPLFVGNATNNGTCQSCYDVCNKSAYVCMSLADLMRAKKQNLSLEYKEVLKWLKQGPTDIVHDEECLCRNNSKSIKCKQCIKGHFFLKSYCQPCQCNGHGDECNDENGNCKCQNNTVTVCTEEPCYTKQCAKCADNYLGRPTDNRQCYSKIIHLNEIVISSKPGSDVTSENNYPPLPKGLSITYVVYPRYTNVDIRTTIDVFQGGVDVYVSTYDRTFAVYVNKTTGKHTVGITGEPRSRRSVDDPNESPHTTVYAGKKKLNTFVSLTSSTDIIKIRSVENRLVLTFPHYRHHLRNSRFYLLLMGVGDDTHDDTTGIIYFRQDLSQIDLFVFFSVFFSVFFLVLALCIVAWKLKQFHDRRRIAQVQERELVTMASRPFATYSFLTDMKTAPQSCWKIKRDNSRRNVRERKGHLLLKEASQRPCILPVALQPAEDTRAAVVSVMFQLPRNENSDFQLVFGSTITTNVHQHSIGSLFGYPLLSGHKTRPNLTVTS